MSRRNARGTGRALRRIGAAVVCAGCVGIALAPSAMAEEIDAGAVVGVDAPVVQVDAAAAAQLTLDTQAATDFTAATLNSLQPLLDGTYSQVAATKAKLETQVDALATSLGVPPATTTALASAALVLAGPALKDTCATLAAITPLVPTSILGIPLNTGLLGGTLAALDRQLSDLVYKQTVGLTNALAPSQLALLKMAWTTSYRKSGGGTIERSIPGYLGVPTLMDVDGQLGYDLCGQLLIDATTGKITQEITRLPLAPAKLPVDVAGVLTSLGNVSLGYATPGSWAPTRFKSVLGLGTGGSLLAFDDTTTGPGPSLVQRIGIAAALAIDFSWTGVPNTAHVDFGVAGTGVSAGLNTSSKTKFGLKLGLGTAAAITADIDGLLPSATNSKATVAFPGAGLQATYDGPAGDAASSFKAGVAIGTLPLSVKASPLPAKLDSCSLLASIACSNVNSGRALSPALTALSSMHFVSSTPVSVEQVALAGASCASGANQYAAFTGKQLYSSWNLNGSLGGHFYVDTGGNPVSGCANALTQTSTYAAGFKAGGSAPTGRLGTFTLLGLLPNSITKSGAITCPAGTKFAIATTDRSMFLCPTPPVNTSLPKIIGTAKVAATLIGTAGAYASQNAATTTTIQWQRCDAAGANCADITGATAGTYKPVAADVGGRIVLRSTATNSDGTASAVSPPTAVVIA
jgi:hypothetical protein